MASMPFGLAAEESPASEEFLPAICRQILADEDESRVKIILSNIGERVKKTSGKLFSGGVEKAGETKDMLVAKVMPEKQQGGVLGASDRNVGLWNTVSDKGASTIDFLMEHWKWVVSGLVVIIVARAFFF